MGKNNYKIQGSQIYIKCATIKFRYDRLKGIWISMPVSDALAFITAVISLIIYIKKVSKQHPIAE